MEAIKSGVIGLGSMGMGWHAETLHRLEQFDLISGCDPSEQRLKIAREQYDCEGYLDYAEMLADPELELVAVATPSSMHAEHAIQALEAGKYCVVEKPFCMNVPEFDTMAAAAKASGKLLCCYQNRRWDAGHLTALNVVRSGVLGELFFIQQMGGSFSRIMLEYGVKEFRPAWRAEKKYGGGMLYDFGAHTIDQILRYVDHVPVKDVYAELRGFCWSDEVDDTVLLVIRFTNGVTATVSTSSAARAAVSGFAIVGRDGAYKDGIIYTGEPGDIVETEAEEVTGHWDEFYLQMYEAIREGAQPPVPLEQTRMLMQIFDATFESSRTGQVVTIS